MELTKYVSVPYECSPIIIYGITMGPTHIIPITDAMGNVWNFTKYVEIPTDDRAHLAEISLLLWVQYGS